MRKLFGAMALAAILATPSTSMAQRPSTSTAQRPSTPTAQRPMRFGAQANWGSDTDFGVGARVNYGLEKIIKNVPLTAMASFDWFFPGNNLTFWEINWDVAYNFRLPQPTIAPYAGAGLGFAYAKVGGGCTNIPGLDCSNTSVGLNLVGGARFKMRGKLTPYVEARADLHSGSQLVLTGGVLF